MNFHIAMIIAAAICFVLAAFGVGSPIINLLYLGMGFFALAFY